MFDFLKKLFPKKKKKPKKKVVKAKKKSSKTSSTKSKNAVCYSRTNSVRLKPSDDTSTSTQSNETEVKTNNTSKGGRKRSKYGFARTKEDPHKRHPALYKKESSDDIKYITFTHSPVVKDENGNPTIITIPLTSNIDPKERGKSKSYIFPKSYKGKRSSLGKEITDLSLTKEDKEIAINAIKSLPEEQVKKTSNSKKKSK